MKFSLWERLCKIFRKKSEVPTPSPVTSDAGPHVDPRLREKRPVGEIVVASAAEAKAFGRLPLAELVIGLDFGTSCTKVVIGDPGWLGKFYAVPFGGAPGELSSWLHPTRLGEEANLKMRLMDEPNDGMVQSMVACYLANVIRHSRQWFENNAPACYQHAKVKWRLNLGFPGKSVETGSELEWAYRTCAELAIQLADKNEVPTVANAERLRSRSVNAEQMPVHLYPEIAAQLAGYIRSPFRQEGPLLLIDVGAGTLDVSTLLFYEQQHRDHISFFFCEVSPLGCFRLYDARITAIKKAAPGSAADCLTELQDGITPIPERWEQMIELRGAEAEECRIAFDQVSQEWTAECVRSALSCVTRFRRHLCEHHNAAGFDPWPSNLRVFLTGGGSRCGLFRKAFLDGLLERALLPFTHWHYDFHQRQIANQGLKPEAFPRPNNLERFPKQLSPDFDRLSVAYGLAQGTLNLMHVQHIQE